MQKNRVAVVARVRARVGMAEQMRAELVALVAPSRRDRGCLSYDLHQSRDDSSLFMFYENWESLADLEAHLKMPRLGAFDERTRELLAEPVDITFWELMSITPELDVVQ